MRAIRGVALIAKQALRSRLGATIAAVVLSETVVWPIAAHLNRLRATDTWLLVYGALFSVIVLVLLLFVPGKTKRRRGIALPVVGTILGFAAGMLASWPATFLAHGAKMTAQGWNLAYQVGGLLSVIEGSALVSFGMLSWLVGALAGVLALALRFSNGQAVAREAE
jgi:hypothetical protein